MKVLPVRNTIAGEQILAVEPALSPYVEGGLRRLNYYTGRTLSHYDLTLEQNVRQQHLTFAAQMLTPGVVSGLTAALDQAAIPDDAPPEAAVLSDFYVQVSAGVGLTHSGEDVMLPQSMRVWLDDVMVIDRSSTLSGSAPADSEAGQMAPRVMGPPLWQYRNLVNPPLLYPHVGILLLRPVTFDLVGEDSPNDPCEADEENFAFEDWQRVDAVQLVLYIWPDDWLVLPPRSNQWRNAIAHSIFNAERLLGSDEALPWAAFGLPIGLIGFNNNWTPDFFDRFSVVRYGGQGQRRQSPIVGSGDGFLWRASIEQFTEHINDLADAPPPELRDAFRQIPPVGFLPKGVLDLVAEQNHFFPPTYDITMRPVPLEQLDLVMQRSAGLKPYNLNMPDQVELLVPVPQTVFEPRLLIAEVIAPEFDQAITGFVNYRNATLDRRANIRTKLTTVVQSLEAEDPDFGPDSEAQPDESAYVPPVITAAHISERRDATHQHFFLGATQTITPQAGDVVTVFIYLDPDAPPQEVMLQFHASDGSTWSHRAFWGANRITWGSTGTTSRQRLGDVPAVGQWLQLTVDVGDVGIAGVAIDGLAYTLYGGRAAWGPTSFQLGETTTVWVEAALPDGATEHGDEPWQWVQASNLLAPLESAYDFQTTDEGAVEPAPLLDLKQYLRSVNVRTRESGAEGEDDPVDKLEELGLVGYIKFLADKIERADDHVNLGFLRVHTDIYRLRQIMLDEAVATQLAVSPALASIAKAETAVATREQISAFYQRIKAGDTAGLQIAATGAEEVVGASQAAGSAGAAAISAAASATAIGTSAVDLGGFDRPILRGGLPVFEPALPAEKPLGINQPVSSLLPGGGQAVEDAKLADIIRKSTTGNLFEKLPYTPDDISSKQPIVGLPLLRTTTIVDRLEAQKSEEAKNFSASTKIDVYRNLADVGLSLEGIQVPGPWSEGDRNVPTDLSEYRDPARLGELLENLGANDEAGHFNNTVDLVDNVVASLRIFEGRIQIYKKAKARCEVVLGQVRRTESQIRSRLRVIETDLAEARHDVSVARALREEELQRLEQINTRRRQILSEQVPFIAYERPRVAEMFKAVPRRSLVPGILEAAVPACLRENIVVPQEIRAITELLRDVPIRFFRYLPTLLDNFRQPQLFYNVFETAQARATNPPSAPLPFGQATTKYAQSINQLFTAQHTIVSQYRSQLTNIGSVQERSWQQIRDLAIDRLSPADFINSRHGKSDVDYQMTRELDNIAHIAACLYEAFDKVLPVLRLEWADDLSQYDRPVNLRNIANLPRWNEIDYILRREIQALVDWLFGRIDPRYSEANDIINDLVRVAILLASEAPVNRIISGRLRQPVRIQLGSRVTLEADLSRVAVGMQVLMYQGNQVAAQAVVQDMGAAGVIANVVKTVTPSVDFTEAAGIEFTSLQSKATYFTREF